MKISKYKKRKNDKLKMKAFKLYKEGFSSREVGRIIERSHEWVLQAVKEIEKGVNNSGFDKV